MNRLKKGYEIHNAKNQFGFRQYRSTSNAILITRMIIRKYQGILVVDVSIDLTAAYDHVPRDFLSKAQGQPISLLYSRRCMKECSLDKRNENHLDEQIGCCQGGLESLCISTYYFDNVLKVVVHEIAKEFPDGWNIPFWYKIPQCCANPKQWSDWKLNFLEIIRWIFYEADIVIFLKQRTRWKDTHSIYWMILARDLVWTHQLRKLKRKYSILKILRIRIVNSVWEQKG